MFKKLLCLWIVCVLVGCVKPKGANSPEASGPHGGTENQLSSDQGWRARPAALAIHPSLREIVGVNESVIRARVRILDEMNDPMKSSGQWRAELFELRGSGRDRISRAIRTWKWDIQTLEHHQTHFDPVTMAYLFEMRMESLLPDGEHELVMYFESAQDNRLKASRALPR